MSKLRTYAAQITETRETHAVFHTNGIFHQGAMRDVKVDTRRIADLKIPADAVAVSFASVKKVTVDNGKRKRTETEKNESTDLLFPDAEVFDKTDKRAKKLQNYRSDTGYIVKMRSGELFAFSSKDAVIKQNKNGKWEKTFTAPALEKNYE